MSTETKTVCLSRRECLQKAAIVGSSLSVAALSGCSEVVRRTIPARVAAEKIALPPTSDLDPVVRLLNRAGFGPAPGDIASVAAQGTVAYVKSQLAAPTDDDAEEMGLKLRLANIEVLSGDPYDLNDLGDSEILRQLSQATLLRAIYSPYQLRERMVDFWSNHFNLYARKRISGGDLSPVFVQSLVGRDSLSVIRQHALGHFPTMLKASARSPAMLTYLDNQKNRKGVANENYAREIMELHTLGIGGGYTQKDVQEVARCLTGWGIEDGFMRNRESFAYDKNQHDDGEKIVLGHRIPSGGGESDGDTVLEILARHPSTAKFIAKKMVNYLYGAEDAGLIAETAAVYSKTDGDISAMVSHLLLSEKMADAPPILKRPFDFVVSALRATNANTDASTGVQAHLVSMGQSPYEWPMPDGYPDKTSAWTGSFLARWNFAFALMGTDGKVSGTDISLPTNATAETLVAQILGRRSTDTVAAPLLAHLAPHTGKPSEMAALLLASPAFQWR